MEKKEAHESHEKITTFSLKQKMSNKNQILRMYDICYFCSDYLKNAEELCIRMCFSFFFFFVFHAKTGIAKNHRNGSSDTS